MENWTFKLAPARFLSITIMLSSAFVSFLLFQTSPLVGIALALWAATRLFYLFSRGQKITRHGSQTEFSCLSVTHKVADDAIEWIYRNPNVIVIRCKKPLGKRIYFGAMTFGSKEIVIRQAYIRKSSELRALVSAIPAPRRRFILRQLLYWAFL